MAASNENMYISNIYVRCICRPVAVAVINFRNWVILDVVEIMIMKRTKFETKPVGWFARIYSRCVIKLKIYFGMMIITVFRILCNYRIRMGKTFIITLVS